MKTSLGTHVHRLVSSVRRDAPEFVWCIEHEQMVKLEHGACVGHAYPVETEFGAEIDFCFLEKGYAFCPPPESLFSDTHGLGKTGVWKVFCQDNQPDYDEQLVMDLQAVSLLEEMEGR